MSELYEVVERPDLDAPVLVLALDGWIDAGLGAATALSTILSRTETVTVATFDTDALLDHRARRPTMHIVDGMNTGLTWPALELRATTDLDGSDVLLLVGAEPDHTWRAFSHAAVDLALEFGTRLVCGFGAYPAPTPHTRPTKVVSTATTEQLAALVGQVPGQIDVPAGVHAAIERRCADVGIPAVGLWAQVPHYAAAMPYPAASLALLETLWRISTVRFDTVDLPEETRATAERLDGLVANSDEHGELVRQLEAHVDAMEDADSPDLPSGDELAEEFQRFLRDQGDA